MKTKRIAINGFGRIGRMVARVLSEGKHPDLQLVAINDLSPAPDLAHLLKYDSIHGRFEHPIISDDRHINFGSGPVHVVQKRDPAQLPWGALDVDIVLECTGHLTNGPDAHKHIEAGAKRVIISAPAKNVDLTVVYGVNHPKLLSEHKVISNASCTTNALAPVAHVLHELAGIKHGFMTTIHAYTGDQRLVDSIHSDLRRARAACMSMIPSTTGAAAAVGLVLPELKGKLDGTAIRVPTANVSVVDLKVVLNQKTSIDQIHEAFIQASNSTLKGVLDTSNEPLVSIDFNHSPFSCTVDLTQTHMVDGELVRILGWYDNEWGFTQRLCDVASYWP